MRDYVIVEIGIREVSTHCEFADIAYNGIDTSGGQDATDTYFFVHSFLSHCSTVASLLWSEELGRHADGQTIADVIEAPGGHRLKDASLGETLANYDRYLARGLALRGSVSKVLDYNIGDRDAFEEEGSIFLRHYDPTVDTLTLMEQEIPLGLICTELLEIKSRADEWLNANAALLERPATISIPRLE